MTSETPDAVSNGLRRITRFHCVTGGKSSADEKMQRINTVKNAAHLRVEKTQLAFTLWMLYAIALNKIKRFFLTKKN